MKALMCFISFFLTTISFGQELEPEIICYASDEVLHTRVMPDIGSSARLSQEPTAEFIVNYVGFSPEAQMAFQQAIDNWSYFISSEVPIRMQANWQALDPGVLGSARSGGSARNFAGAPQVDIDYPMPLAEKLARQNLNGSSEADIIANFSSNINWYYGLDGNAPEGTYDLVTVVMHEIGHGLGIAGSFGANVEAEIADHSLFTGFPRIYDTYLTTGSTIQVIDRSVYNTQSIIYTAVTSGNLIFRSELARIENGASFPPIFSPNPFNPGSSVSHLNEGTYPGGDPNSMMTPFIGQAEAIHSPGEVLLAMMADMGWEYAFFDPTILPDTEDTSSDIVFETSLQSDMEVNEGTLSVQYSYEGGTWTDAMLIQAGESYTASISNPGAGTMEYRFSLVDEYDREIVSDEFTFIIGQDLISPVVNHTPLVTVRKFGNTELPEVDVDYSDNIGVQSAIMEFFLNNGETAEIDLLADEPSFPFQLSELSFGDVISYRFVVTDNSSNQNVAQLPEDGYFSLLVVDIITEDYSTDFELGRQTFTGNYFSLDQPDGFTSLAIQSPHPTETVSSDNYLTFIGEILMDEQFVVLSYSDIAMIEPGIEGATFGISAFKDYISIEASTDGENWIALEGYDASYTESWKLNYESDVEQGVSQFVPDEAFFEDHVVVLNDFFSQGDLVQLRFHFYTNDSNYGWGWCLDDFAITRSERNPVILGNNGEEVLTIYPNPSQHSVRVTGSLDGAEYRIDSPDGKRVASGIIKNGLIEFDERMKSGMYIISVSHQGKKLTKRVIKE